MGRWDRDAGNFFVTGVALGSAGGIQVRSSPLGEPYLWPLQPDLLLRVSLGIPTLRGVLDAQGIGQPYLSLPHDPVLGGLYLSASALTLDALGVRTITRDVRALVVQ